MSLMSELNHRALTAASAERTSHVTYRCNERCEHCYLEHDGDGEMTTGEIKGILDQLATAGVFFNDQRGRAANPARLLRNHRTCPRATIQRQAENQRRFDSRERSAPPA